MAEFLVVPPDYCAYCLDGANPVAMPCCFLFQPSQVEPKFQRLQPPALATTSFPVLAPFDDPCCSRLATTATTTLLVPDLTLSRPSKLGALHRHPNSTTTT
ncbi:hypothetical protein ACJRO7_001754 [Eucalyptus globulus]|uniref:Uncharacterized protein n=1 Tax=Eucalyptus globulus TaxID=34317 RepID=A0ABD3LVL7_EUCGL